MLRGDAADQAGVAQVGAPELFQGVDFVGQLAQGFIDALGFAGGAGGAQAQLAAVEVQRFRRKGLAEVGGQVGIAGLVGQPQVDVARPALPGLRLQVGGQQHAHPGPPGAEQGNRQVGGVFQVHGNALHALGLQMGRQAQGLFAQLGMVQRRNVGHGSGRWRLEQQLLKFDPLHGWPRSRCRMSHSMANIRPINP